MTARHRHPTPRPFVKWVGGKGQLLPILLERVQKAPPFHRYLEPFVGGGALFFALGREGYFGAGSPFGWPVQPILSDMNHRLIEAWCTVRDELTGLLELLQDHAQAHSQDHYYQVREEEPTRPLERTARLIYLNKTCFNGLYRENSKGKFNVPFGRYANPTICDEENLRAVSQLLQGVDITRRSFEQVLQEAQPGDLVYFDPPYHPLSETSSFTAYFQDNFDESAQRLLADVCVDLTARGVSILLSNSTAPLIQALYRNQPGLIYEEVLASRMVNRNADSRGKIGEALVRSFGT